MIEMLREYLGGVMSPEAGDVFLNASRQLEEAGFLEHQHHLAELMSLADNFDTTYLTTSIESTLMRAYYEVIGSFGIYLQEASLNQLVDIFTAMYQLGNYGDPQSVVDIVNGTEDAEEALAEVLSMLTDHDVSDLLIVIEDVTPSLMRNIVEKMEQLEENVQAELGADDPEVGEFLNYVRARLHAYLTQPHANNLIISHDIALGMTVLLPFDTYISQAEDTLSRVRDPIQLGREILAMALASSLQDEDILSLVSETLQEFVSDIVTITRVEDTIRTDMAEVSRVLRS